MNPIKEGEPVMPGRIFRLTRQVTGETDAHVYGEAGEIVVVTGSHRVMNAFEVLPVDVSLYEKEGYFTPFIVTLDDVASLAEEEQDEVNSELAEELLGYYNQFLLEQKDHLYGELINLMQQEHENPRQVIEDFLNELIEFKGGAFVFGNLGNRG
ncbi:hypothetical protein [Atopococcus tabaci]|uniref:hypothetical protein n=1 Tax=Atopococcus tabaci TaxID=269774 RepID=UPI0024091070|nr:hypothetical protein [Atopococcus tabaci]